MTGGFVRVVVDTGGLVLRCRADLALALRYQRALARQCPDFRVTIDDGDTSSPRAIPCAALFTEA